MANQNTRGLTADELEQIRQGNAAGDSLNEISKRLGRSTSTIHDAGNRMEPKLSWDTSRVQAANVARADQARQRRQREADRIHGLFDIAATQGEAVLEGKFKTTLKGEYGLEREVELDFIPTNNFRELAAALTQLTNAAMKIESVDVDAELTKAKSLVTDLASELGVLPMEPE